MTRPISPQTQAVARALQQMLQGEVGDRDLIRAMRLLAKWRANLIETTLVKRSGRRVLSGPFQGMDYAVGASEGSRVSRLIGCYEASLHPVIEEIVRRAYGLVIDIGAAEGYYAVGLALRMPTARVMARDESLQAQAKCRALAVANGVGDRVKIGGRMDHADFEICSRQPTLVLCDIEGAEAELLDPQRAPGLSRADVLVEVHDCLQPGLSKQLADRFAATHRVEVIGRRLDDSALPVWMEGLSDMDRLIAMWEWRTGPTPWLWMVRK